ncbi:MAG: hypothetical protein HYZ14_11815 [Bacteroidetes bacterium]|nr:hypothetical protein [Bacteroidota bacterium]
MQNQLIFCLLALLMTACSPRKDSVQHIDSATNLRDTSGGQKNVRLLTDEPVSVEMPITGIAQNQKGGAVLVTKTQTYWIDGLTSWDDQWVDRPVRVWGDLMIRNDNPVFLDTSEIVSQGIPVETEEELNAQRSRYWIINATYELVRP